MVVEEEGVVTVVFADGGLAVWPDDFNPSEGELPPVVGERLGGLRVVAVLDGRLP